MRRDIAILLTFYLVGSIPFSYIVTRLKTGKDIRHMGSGNVGATNVMRTSGKKAGLLALSLDLAKGAIAVGICLLLGAAQRTAAMAGLAAMIGHSYPVFLHFRGGKSVATGAGAFLILSPLAVLSAVGVFAVAVAFVRIVSLGSLLASLSFPVFLWVYGGSSGIIWCGALAACLILYRHRSNIVRLIHGTERRIGDKEKDA